MNEVIEQRLDELRRELAHGEHLLHDLRMRQDNLRETMLRISGAIEILEELHGHQAAEPRPGA